MANSNQIAVEYAADAHTLEVKTNPGMRHQPATGYGRKIATDYMVRLDGRGPWRRVYYTIFSSIGSHWVTFEGGKLFLHDWDLKDNDANTAGPHDRYVYIDDDGMPH